jgi:hypothetical protein
MTLFDIASTATIQAVLIDCKFPASYSGSLASLSGNGSRIAAYNCDSTDTNYKLWIEDYRGTIRTDDVIYRSGGASDGTTPISWKMTSNANTEWLLRPLWSDPIVMWNSTTGSSQTATIEIVHDAQGSGTSGDFTDKEVWAEVMYLGTSGVPLGTIGWDRAATPLTTASDQDSSSETWTGTSGFTSEVKQKIAVTFTAQEVGYIAVRAALGVASKTVYVDPKITLS